jgi:hypothetical protein
VIAYLLAVFLLGGLVFAPVWIQRTLREQERRERLAYKRLKELKR